MPVVEGRHNGRQILTPVFVAPPAQQGQHLFETGIALIDTGATTSLVGQTIARQLALPPRGKRQMVTARGAEMVTQYRFRLGFPSEPGAATPYLLDGDFNGSELIAQTGFDVIIGMDVLATCAFQMFPDATWLLRY
jgi:hypothetical protein